jgi:hypothetical protein
LEPFPRHRNSRRRIKSVSAGNGTGTVEAVIRIAIVVSQTLDVTRITIVEIETEIVGETVNETGIAIDEIEIETVDGIAIATATGTGTATGIATVIGEGDKPQGKKPLIFRLTPLPPSNKLFSPLFQYSC